MRKIAFIIACLLVPLWGALAETDKLTDLQAALSATEDPEKRIELLVELSRLTATNDVDRSIAFGRQAVGIAREIDSELLLARALDATGESYFYKGQFDEGIYSVLEALKLFEQINDVAGIGNATVNLGALYVQAGDNVQAEFYLLKGLEYAPEINDPNFEAPTYFALGVLYFRRGDIERALEVTLKSLVVLENHKESLHYATALNNMGKLHFVKGDLSEAERYYREAISLAKRHNLTISVINLQSNLAEVLLKAGDAKGAEMAGLDAYALAAEVNSEEELKRTALRLSELYSGMGDFEKALDYYQTHIEYKDLQFNTEKAQQIAEVQTRYDVEKKEAENLRLIHENEIQLGQLTIATLETSNLQRTISLGTLLLAVFVLGGIYLLQLNNKLRVARALAEEAAEAKAKFLATMTHEIRTPMTGVVGMVDVLRDTELSTAQDKMLRTIKESGLALLTIINDLLDFSKLEAGKLAIERIPMSIISTVEGVSETLLPLAAKNRVKLMTFIDPAVPHMLVGDPVRIRQIIFNIAGNAMKFSGTVDGKPGTVIMNVTVTNEADRDMLTIIIQDNGIGMSDEVVAGLFQEYVQAEAGTARKFGGTGLGLSICKTLTDLMGGTIDVTSEAGVGSIFTVALPLEPVSSYRSDWPPLEGVTCRIAIETPELAAYLKTYFGACGVTLDDKAADIVIAEHTEADGDAGTCADGMIRDGTDRTRVLLLTDNRLTETGSIRGDLSVVENNPVALESLHRQLAVLDGRIKSAPSPATGTAGKASLAPTREQALEAHQLILLADDNPVNRNVIGRQLNILGYACDTAADGEIAFDMWQQNRYALLITDWHMPNLGGADLAAAIRGREHDQDLDRVPVIVASGTLIDEGDPDLLRADIDLQLLKPLDMAKLKASLLTHMDS